MMFRYLNESDIKWLKNRRNDRRPEVKELARQIFEEKFPRQARNEIKQRLHAQNITFHVCGEIFDSYGDEYFMNAEYIADTSGKIIKKLFDENNAVVEEKPVEIGQKDMRKFFNVMVHNDEIPFLQIDLCNYDISYESDIDFLPEYKKSDDYDIDDFEEDEIEDNEDEDGEVEQSENDDNDIYDNRIPSWSIEIKYKNGTGQNIKGYDLIPDPVMELFADFEDYFEEDYISDEFDEGDFEPEEPEES